MRSIGGAVQAADFFAYGFPGRDGVGCVNYSIQCHAVLPSAGRPALPSVFLPVLPDGRRVFVN
jgi:hypothetical protein